MDNLEFWNLLDWDVMDWVAGPGNFIVLILALLLDGVIGDPRWIPHPIRALGGIIRWLEAQLNHSSHSNFILMGLGAFTSICVIVIAGLAGWLISYIASVIPFGWLIEIIAITMMIAQRSMIDHTYKVVCALRTDGINGARFAVSKIVGRDTKELDKSGVSRAAIESVAESFTDGVVAPIFWYMIFGIPGLFIYKAISTLDSMVGYRTPKYKQFGAFSARIDDVVNWIPARIAGPMLVMAACFYRDASAIKAFVTLFRDSSKHLSPNAGWTEAAMAGALGLRLLGPRIYNGKQKNELEWIGEGKTDADEKDIFRALYLYGIACFLIIIILVLIFVITQFS